MNALEAVETPDEQALTSSDFARLARLEVVIEDGLATFVKVGGALLEIRSKRLYRESHETFEDYCDDKWQMSKTHANRLVQSAEVAQALTPIGVIPSSESQARELAPLLSEPELLREAWQEVVEQYPTPTAADVREIVQQRRPTPPRQQPVVVMGGEREQHKTMVRVWDTACLVLDNTPANAAAKADHLIGFDGPGPVTSERLDRVAVFAAAAADELRRRGH